MSPFPLLVLLLAFLAGPVSAAEPWRATLYSGQGITVDPRTHRVTVETGAGPMPLWDGIHRLADGTPITVRAGIMVPNARFQAFQREQRQPAQAVVGAGPAACEALVRSACGRRDQCAEREPCAIARQLLARLVDELRTRDTGAARDTVGQCQGALADDTFFTPCP